jgi:hypothetical protein
LTLALVALAVVLLFAAAICGSVSPNSRASDCAPCR